MTDGVFFLVVGVLIWTIPTALLGARLYVGGAIEGKNRHLVSLFFVGD